MYPDIGEIAKDVYFALAYQVVMYPTKKSQQVFEDLAKHVFVSTKNVDEEKKRMDSGKIESDVSQFWCRLYKEVVLDVYEQYETSFSEAGDNDVSENNAIFGISISIDKYF